MPFVCLLGFLFVHGCVNVLRWGHRLYVHVHTHAYSKPTARPACLYAVGCGDRRVTYRGMPPCAVKMTADFSFGGLGHRYSNLNRRSNTLSATVASVVGTRSEVELRSDRQLHSPNTSQVTQPQPHIHTAT